MKISDKTWVDLKPICFASCACVCVWILPKRFYIHTNRPYCMCNHFQNCAQMQSQVLVFLFDKACFIYAITMNTPSHSETVYTHPLFASHVVEWIVSLIVWSQFFSALRQVCTLYTLWFHIHTVLYSVIQSIRCVHLCQVPKIQRFMLFAEFKACKILCCVF